MVDKLRKAALWVWLMKERIVLLIMVGVLCYQVYQVFGPQEVVDEIRLRPPATTMEGARADLVPPNPGFAPPRPVPGGYANLYNQNPFWYYSGSRGAGATSQADLEISLVQIQKVGNRFRAKIKTRSASKWYDEGDAFEEFVLESISPDDETVVVYAESLAKRITLELP